MKNIILGRAICACVLTMLVAAGCSESASKKNEVSGSAVGEEDVRSDAPDFTLPMLGGGKFKLSSLKGKVVILDFWATWCPPCREEIPDFIALKNKYADKGLEIVGVALDNGGEKDVAPFAKEQGINYITVIGDDKITQKYGGIRGIPTTFIIDTNGKIVEKHVGLTSREVFEESIINLLPGKK